MKDAITNLYNDIKTNLLALQVDGVNIVSDMSFWNENTREDEFNAIKRDSSVFMQYSVDWNTKPNYSPEQEQVGICEFTLYVVRKSIKNDNDATLEILNSRNEIMRSIMMLQGENYSHIRRSGETSPNAHTNVIYYQLRFRCFVYETATELFTVVNPDISLNKQIVLNSNYELLQYNSGEYFTLNNNENIVIYEI